MYHQSGVAIAVYKLTLIIGYGKITHVVNINHCDTQHQYNLIEGEYHENIQHTYQN